jgi:membrane carboxypeptidase/penicillin-binding protein
MRAQREMVKPQFVSEIKEWNKTIKKYEKEVLNPEFALRDYFKVKSGVVKGTASKLYSDFSMAGKTGTAAVNQESWWSWKILRLFFWVTFLLKKNIRV